MNSVGTRLEQAILWCCSKGQKVVSVIFLPPITKTFVVDCEFGLSFLSPEARYFTEHERNPDYPTIPKHAMIFKNKDDPNMFLIGFENLSGEEIKIIKTW
jgi:hypothetical protein